ncbi:MAG: alpha/beta hydrolase [Rhodospirillales bacterium]|nr:alpha/beta hydrolase [Rhodospirillales bacterium]
MDTNQVNETALLNREDGPTIAYHQSSGKSPGVVFLTGFKSDMSGSKALALETHCRKRGQAFLRFDYSGHGQSSGAFVDGCIGQWAADAVTVLDQLTTGPQVLVGSSMGGWIMLLAALQRPQRIAGLIGIAAAPDFTEDLMWNHFTADQQRQISEQGYVDLPNCYEDEEPYRITQKLIEDGRNQLLLGGPLALDMPVRLIQGMEDADVPWATAGRIMAQVTSADVEISYVKSGDHRLSEPADLARLCRTLDALLDQLSIS